MKAVIDFETVDRHIETLGSGWVHGQDFEVIGASIHKDGWDKPKWFDQKEDILREMEDVKVVIAHNAQYDIGILHMWGYDIFSRYIVDTLLIAKLYNSTLISYSLDALSKKYLNKSKTKDEMAHAVLNNKLINCRLPEDGQWTKLHVTKGWNYAIKNMDVMYDVARDVVIDYADSDVALTRELYDLMIRDVPEEWVKKLSKMVQILIKNREKGVRVDIERVKEVRSDLEHKELALKSDVYSLAGEEFNINSNKELPTIFDKLGIKYPLTPQGRPSIQKDWLVDQDHPFCKALNKYRKYQKARRDFCDTLLEAQEMLPDGKKGRVYPEFIPFGARTGRFSCRNPNIQQIPSRDEDIGPLIRSFYIPEEGETWYSLDFSSQESRLQVHYANIADIEGGPYLAQEYKKDPRLDLHTIVADICGISRNEAKTINLGISYGMGVTKLSKSLGITEYEAKEVRAQYNEHMPYLTKLSRLCQDAMKTRQYVRTLGGRKSHNDAPVLSNGEHFTFEYKALNKLIQGSAADQAIEAMIQADEAGIPFLFSVHDEINASLKTKEEAKKLQAIMQSCVQLTVPMVTDIGEGSNWAEAK